MAATAGDTAAKKPPAEPLGKLEQQMLEYEQQLKRMEQTQTPLQKATEPEPPRPQATGAGQNPFKRGDSRDSHGPQGGNIFASSSRDNEVSGLLCFYLLSGG